jgi:hypothetical protein
MLLQQGSLLPSLAGAESKHNLERPVKTEFSNLICQTADKQTLLFLHYLHLCRSSFLNKWERGNCMMGQW